MLTPWQQFGLIGLMIGAIVALLFIIIKWTLATTKEILKQASDERECWIRAFNDHTAQAKSFHDEVKNAHEHQRREHEKLQEQQIKSILCLDQVEKALGRINGYK